MPSQQRAAIRFAGLDWGVSLDEAAHAFAEHGLGRIVREGASLRARTELFGLAADVLADFGSGGLDSVLVLLELEAGDATLAHERVVAALESRYGAPRRSFDGWASWEDPTDAGAAAHLAASLDEEELAWISLHYDSPAAAAAKRAAVRREIEREERRARELL